MIRSTIKFIVIAAWFIAQPEAAKKMYMRIVMANEAVNIPKVEPIRRARQPRESVFSIFSRQNSAHV